VSYNEVCDALAAAGLPHSRSHVNGLVRARKLRVTRPVYHLAVFNPDQVRAFISKQLSKKKGAK
jgi:hypothetical protein